MNALMASVWYYPETLVVLYNFLMGNVDLPEKDDEKTVRFVARCIDDYIKSGRMYDVKVSPRPDKRKKSVRKLPKRTKVRGMRLKDMLRDEADDLLRDYWMV
jgi:hypothetical protein